MSYNGPCLNDLRAFAEELKKTYTDVNSDRLSFIALYDQLVKQTAMDNTLSLEEMNNILRGALVFAMTDIKYREYKGASPKKREGYFWSSGSDLYTAIRAKLLITKKNKFGYDERISYLNDFYKYIDKIYPEGYDLDLMSKSERNPKKIYLEVTTEGLRYEVKGLDQKIINQTIPWDKLPLNFPRNLPQIMESKDKYLSIILNYTSKAGHTRLQGIDELRTHNKLQSNNIKPKWKTKEELRKNVHDTLDPVLKRNTEDLYHLIHGVPVLNALLINVGELEAKYQANSYNPTNPVRLESINCIKFILESYHGMSATDVSWHVISGAVLMALLQINKEYKWFFSPTRSTLYRESLQALNQGDINKITIDDKIKWLRLLSSHIISTSENGNKYDRVLKQVVANTKNQILDTEKLDKQVKDFQSRVELFITELDEEKKTPSFTTNVIKTGTSFAFQQATGQLVIQTANNLLIGELLGTALFGVAGTFFMSSFVRLITQGAITTATAGLFSWLLGKIGDSVGTVTATVVTYPFSAAPKGLEEMRARLKPVDDIAFVRMVNTLLELDIIPDDDKKHIRNFMGLEENEKLQPLKTSIMNEEEKQINQQVMVAGQHARFLDDATDSFIDENSKLSSRVKLSI